MANFNYTGFLCAHFSIPDKTDVDAVMKSNGWDKVTRSAADIELYKRYFYPEFVDFSFGVTPGKSAQRYRKTINTIVDVDGVNVRVAEIVMYAMPFGLMLYSIRVDIESDSLDDITRAMFRSRDDISNQITRNASFVDAAVRPIIKVFNAMGHIGNEIVENGNKFKLFQIVIADKAEHFGAAPDDTLFEVATLSKVGGIASGEPDSPSRTYIDSILTNNRLSYYNNWRGLALNDTFTILAHDVKPWVMEVWTDDYFAMIYIHALFNKFYLFKLNERFRTNRGNGQKLEDELKDFERTCMFLRISYNFLPEEISAAVDKSLQIRHEKDMLADFIATCNKQQVEVSTRRLNVILAALTIITVFSTVWDTACLVNALWPSHSMALDYVDWMRWIVGIMMSALILVGIFILKRKPR